MKKVAIVYWSGTGNTAAMAQLVKKGVIEGGAAPTILEASDFAPARLGEFDAVIFGCPAMGAEELEEGEFAPMFEDLEDGLSGRRVALFGSYGWGDGQWMRDWAERAQGDGAQLFSQEGLICNETPDEDVQAACRQLGADLAAW